MATQSPTYPSLEQYQEALQNPSTTLTDLNLKAGRVRKSGLGIPLALCGGFALTYTVSCASGKFAVRCFHKKSPDDLERRYAAIAQSLRQLKSSYFVDFEFQASGICVGGNHFPIVKMAWAEGETLGEFLENRYTDRTALQQLRKSLNALEKLLRQNGIAHGDLQPGNLIVSQRGAGLKLIDYDGMFVDELKALKSAEDGQRNFQHPGRTGRDFNAKLDRFSFILLDCALRALELEPSLWGSTKSDGDAILFRANDFADPSSATSFRLIEALPLLNADIRNFEQVCSGPYAAIPSLEDFQFSRNIPAAIISSGSLKPQLKYLAAHPVVDARDYSQCAGHVGERVELIGRIVLVKDGVTVNNDRYVFVNFGDWRGNITRLTIWSGGLKKLRQKPDASWVGQWITAVGMVETPYTNKRYGYSHLSITITENSQFTVISEADALFRLGGSSRNSSSSAQNAKIVQSITGRTPQTNATGAPSKNQQILSRLGRPSPGSTRQQPTSSLNRRSTPSTTPQNIPARSPAPQTPSPSNSPGGCLVVLVILGGLSLLASQILRVPMTTEPSRKTGLIFAETTTLPVSARQRLSPGMRIRSLKDERRGATVSRS